MADSFMELRCLCINVCIFWYVPSQCNLFQGLSSALRSHDQFQASHWSSLPPSRAPDKFNPFKPYLKTIQILADSLWLKNAKIYNNLSVFFVFMSVCESVSVFLVCLCLATVSFWMCMSLCVLQIEPAFCMWRFCK